MKGIRSSLTLRIFAITSLLLIAASAVTYALIARLTPISYTALLADELERDTQALLAQLSRRAAGDCLPLIDDFTRRTGAKLLLVAGDEALYDTLGADEASTVVSPMLSLDLNEMQLRVDGDDVRLGWQSDGSSPRQSTGRVDAAPPASTEAPGAASPSDGAEADERGSGRTGPAPATGELPSDECGGILSPSEASGGEPSADGDGALPNVEGFGVPASPDERGDIPFSSEASGGEPSADENSALPRAEAFGDEPSPDERGGAWPTAGASGGESSPGAAGGAFTSIEAMDVLDVSVGGESAVAGDGFVQYEQQVMIAGEADAGAAISSYSFLFSDGMRGDLTVQGGLRAVNQAVEALDRLLPPLLAIMLAFSLLGSFFYARFITRPIVSLSRIARRLAGLDFTARWDARRTDEIGVLGDSLNLLSDNLSGALDELQTANQALRRDIERERELERQRLAFFSAASHELKTPVTILRGQLSGMLARVGVYRDRERYLARALEVTGRMEGLIREILTISRIESGGFALPAERVEIGALLDEQIGLDRELIDEKALRLEADIRPGCFVSGSKRLLANALDNALMNAILYSPRGAALRVRLIGRDLRVENTGAALPEDALKQLFTPFYRVEPSRNRKSGGSGLGLYLTRRILALHGADCGVENIEDGVRFWARFS